MKVKLGKQASIFHDPTVGITITTGQIVTITNRQSTSPKIMRAIRSGYLVKAENVETEDTKPTEPAKELNVKELTEQFEYLKNENKTAKEISKSFTKEEIVAIAKEFGFEVEPDDSKTTIVEAILAE